MVAQGILKRTGRVLILIHNLFNYPDTLNNITTPTITGNNKYAINVVQNNTTVLDSDGNLNLLLYKEAFHSQKPITISLNKGLKSSSELCPKEIILVSKKTLTKGEYKIRMEKITMSCCLSFCC